jgi:PAS domain S-box-containing protein
MDPLQQLFSSDAFMPHGHCYLWTPSLVWLHAVSDALIALAYASIPFAIVYFVRRRHDLPFHWIFLAFGVFIVACGATHAMEVWNLWHADYWIAGVIKAVTAAASLTTAVALVRVMPTALALPSPEALRKVHEQLRRAHDELETRVIERTAELDGANRALRTEVKERKAAEERFRLLAEGVSDYAIDMLDTQGRVETWTAGGERILGYRADEIVGRHFSCFYTPEDVASGGVARHLERAAAEGHLEYECRHLRKDGSEFHASVAVTALKDEAGALSGFAQVIRDLTERSKAAEELRKTEAQLLHAQKMEAVGRLAGGVAHDFNNLLGVIVGYTELLRRQVPDADAVRGRIDKILDAAEQATTLTRQLLAFSRRQILQPRVLDLNELVAGMHDMLRRLIGEDVDLVTRPAASLGRVRADRGQIEQVIMNLAVNARDAMPQGGRLTIETAEVTLGAEYADAHVAVTPGPHVLLAVSDTGSGMDAETRARIFEPFFTTKPEGKGTGLGLATVYGIVKQSGGNIWVYSEPGRGTTFKVYLPEVREAVDRDVAPAGAADLPRGHETVLVVEDQEMLREMISEALRAQGYEVLPARDAVEAQHVAARHTRAIHLLLTDLVMPGMGGRELARRLLASRQTTRVLYMSGYTGEAVARHGIEEGLPFLEKPFTTVALARRIRKVLDDPPLGEGPWPS